MAKVMNLEEMLATIGLSRKEEMLCMNSKIAAEKVREFRKRNGYGFVPDEYFLSFKEGVVRTIARGVFEPCVWEMVYNAVRSGNKYTAEHDPLPDADSRVTLRLHAGEKGIIAEIEDEGEGIPERIIDILNKEDYKEDFIYRDEKGKERGCGFHNVKLALKDNHINAVGFNKKRNAIYLMALYR